MNDTDSGWIAGPVTPATAAATTPDTAPPPPDRPLVWRAVLGAVVLAALFPTAQAVGLFWTATSRRPAVADGWLEALPVLASAALIATWVFVFWSLIGSFLNVVVHRLPRSESVITGGSRCPRCTSAIRWHDNLPIVGWLRLGGRCRTCGLPIAERYPLVEAACAGLGTAVFFRELVSGGMNLPVRAIDFRHGGLLQFMPDPRSDLVGLAMYHSGLLCVLLAWGLIVHDGGRVPARSIFGTLAVAAALAILFPMLHVLPWATPDSWPLPIGAASPFVGSLAGGLCGWLVTAVLGRGLQGDAAGRSGQPLAAPRQLAAALALVGAVCGWQGMLGTTSLLLAACLLQMIVWATAWWWPTLEVELLLVPAAFVHLCFWRQLTNGLGRFWPAAEPSPLCLVMPAALLLAVWAALVTIAPPAGQARSRGPA